MAILEAYFDESYGSGGPLCVAGYVFNKTNARSLDKEWRGMLRRWKLPYFRMSACAHYAPPFKDVLRKDQCVEVEKEAIALIRRHALCGVAATVDEEVFERVTKRGLIAHLSANPYEFCAWTCALMVRNWAEDSFKGGPSSITYFFEAGHQHQNQANVMMDKIAKDERARALSMYAGHAFVEKLDARPTQAADLLAWQWFTDCKRRVQPKYAPRKDLAALIENKPRHLVMHADESYLTEMLSDMDTYYRSGGANDWPSLRSRP